MIDMLRIVKIIGTAIIAIMAISCSTYNNSNYGNYRDLIIRENNGYILFDTSGFKSEAVDHVIKGSTYQQKQKYAEAILEFQQALKYDSSVTIIYAIARSYYKLGLYDLAQEYAVKSLGMVLTDSKEPHFIPAMELLSDIYVMKRDLKNAIVVYNQILEYDSSYSRKSYIARLYEIENPQKALTIYEELLSKMDNPDILIRIAGLYESLGDTAKMIDSYEKLLKYSSNSIESYELILRAYLENGNFSKALFTLDSTKNLFSTEDINYLFNITGNFFLDEEEKDVTSIIPDYLKLLGNDYYFDWRLNMIAAYLSDKINDSTAVVKFFERALGSDSIADIPLAISSYYSQKGKNQEALEVLNRFENKYKGNFNFPFYKGLIYSELDSFRPAIDQFYSALKIDSSKFDIWGQLGIIYDRLKIYDSCDFSYNKVLAVDPENPLINNNYAYSLSVRGIELEKALVMSSVALGQEPENPSYLDTYGWIHYNMENYEIALEYIKKALNYGDASAEVYMHLGYIYLKMNEEEKAIESFRKSLEIDSSNADIVQQLKLLTN